VPERWRAFLGIIVMVVLSAVALALLADAVNGLVQQW
jgi:hypothetical protein